MFVLTLNYKKSIITLLNNASTTESDTTMSTRSLIAQQQDDGSLRVIYCHYDGYPEHHGPILTEHYTDPVLVTALIDLGDLSVLAEQIGEPHNFDWRHEFYRSGTDYNTDRRNNWC